MAAAREIYMLDIDRVLTAAFRVQSNPLCMAYFLYQSTVEWMKSQNASKKIDAIYFITGRHVKVMPKFIIDFCDTLETCEDLDASIKKRNPDNFFTYKLVEHFLELTGLNDKFIGVSTPEDRGMKCGDAYLKHLKPYEAACVASREILGHYPLQDFLNRYMPDPNLYYSQTKNFQILQVMADAERRFGAKSSFNFHFVDDVERLIAYASHLPMPKNRNLFLYHTSSGGIGFEPMLISNMLLGPVKMEIEAKDAAEYIKVVATREWYEKQIERICSLPKYSLMFLTKVQRKAILNIVTNNLGKEHMVLPDDELGAKLIKGTVIRIDSKMEMTAKMFCFGIFSASMRSCSDYDIDEDYFARFERRSAKLFSVLRPGLLESEQVEEKEISQSSQRLSSYFPHSQHGESVENPQDSLETSQLDRGDDVEEGEYELSILRLKTQ